MHCSTERKELSISESLRFFLRQFCAVVRRSVFRVSYALGVTIFLPIQIWTILLSFFFRGKSSVFLSLTNSLNNLLSRTTLSRTGSVIGSSHWSLLISGNQGPSIWPNTYIRDEIISTWSAWSSVEAIKRGSWTQTFTNMYLSPEWTPASALYWCAQVGFVYLAMTKCFQHSHALVHPRVRRERAVQIWGGFLGGTSLECGNIPASVKNVDHSSLYWEGGFPAYSMNKLYDLALWAHSWCEWDRKLEWNRLRPIGVSDPFSQDNLICLWKWNFNLGWGLRPRT